MEGAQLDMAVVRQERAVESLAQVEPEREENDAEEEDYY